MITSAIDAALGMSQLVLGVYGPLTFLLIAAVITPHLSVSVRRLHDTDRSGWWLLIGVIPMVAMFLVPVIGWALVAIVNLVAVAVLIYWLVLDGTAGPNRYGSDPKEGERAGAAKAT